MFRCTRDHRLLRVESESEWRMIPYNMEDSSWHGDKLFVGIGRLMQDGCCEVNKPDSFPCNIFIRGDGACCGAVLISDEAAVDYINRSVDSTIDKVESLQRQMRDYLEIQRQICNYKKEK